MRVPIGSTLFSTWSAQDDEALLAQGAADHIDVDSLAALPRAPGVYTFHGDGSLPLYIGKSVNIRARVLSHLRNAGEARLIAQTRRIDFIRTAGDLGAQLMEAQLIKAHHPLFNVRLRQSRSLHALRLEEGACGWSVDVVDGRNAVFGSTAHLHGLFSSKRAALEHLRALAHDRQLCLSALGLEKAASRGCFGLQIKTCRGVCVGREARATHDARLLDALLESTVHVWPYEGAIDIVETFEGWEQRHRVHNWCYLGSWDNEQAPRHAPPSPSPCPSFDLDTYKILVRPLIQGSLSVQAAAHEATTKTDGPHASGRRPARRQGRPARP